MVQAPPAQGSIGSTSSSLIARIKEHDQDAWRRLVYLYGPLVFVWLQQAKLQPADAHDVVQEVFQAVARGIAQFQRAKSSDTFRGWLRTIVQHKLADHFRRLEKQPPVDDGSRALQQFQQAAAPHETPPHSVADQEAQEEAEALQQLRLRALELMREKFEPRAWEMFWRVAVQRESTTDVARLMNVSPAAVRMNKSRVLRRLRIELGDLYD